jgi:hypothetical protein
MKIRLGVFSHLDLLSSMKPPSMARYADPGKAGRRRIGIDLSGCGSKAVIVAGLLLDDAEPAKAFGTVGAKSLASGGWSR